MSLRTTILLFYFYLVIMGIGLLPIQSVSAEVFYAKDEALKLAFPDAEKIEPQTYILNEAEKQQVERLAKTRVESNLFTFYRGYKGTELLGYAAIDTHTVRTMPETFMMVLSPEGTQKQVVMLAFYEPLDYLPSQKWLHQFEEKKLSDELWPGRAIHGIVGSTFTSSAMTQGVRKILAMYEVLIVSRSSDAKK